MAQAGNLLLTAPPRPLLGHFLTSGDGSAICDWLLQEAPRYEGAIISLDMLAYGGLIASRLPSVTVREAQRRLNVLAEIKRRYPHFRIFANSVLMRLTITGSGPETVEQGQLIYQWATAAGDPSLRGHMAEVEKVIHPILLAQFVAARARNLAIHFHALQLVAHGVLDHLLVLQEDSAPVGLHRQEQALIESRAADLQLGSRARLLSGADEGALLHLCRAILHDQVPPAIKVECSHSGPSNAICQMVEQQVATSGARVGPGGLLLFVYAPPPGQPSGEEATQALHSFADKIKRSPKAAVVDAGTSLGTQESFTRHLLDTVDWTNLYGYAAGNASSTRLAAAIATAVIRDAGGSTQAVLLERLADDWGYQTVIRHRLNARLKEEGLSPMDLGSAWERVSAEAGAEVADLVRQLASAKGLLLSHCIAHLPWPRTFEIDIDLALG